MKREGERKEEMEGVANMKREGERERRRREKQK